MIMAQYEFLPLCDVLFNIISLAAFFSDVVFDVVMGYALLVHYQYEWFVFTVIFVMFSSVVEQTLSLRWYLRASRDRVNDENKNEGKNSVKRKVKVSLVVLMHLAQVGVLWRYFKLFIPVDLRFVKYEVRDLCVLRLVHAFCESVPLLLAHLYLFWENLTLDFSDLNTVSVLLSLFNVCWALASFSKNIRKHNVHRLVLTWLGVIFQFFWRLGTVSARAISLIAYASLFKSWVFLVILLHWLSMLLWLLSPKNLFHGESLSLKRKALLYSVIAFVYTFAYVNLLEDNHREKMMMFYIIMGLENALLMFVWVVGVSNNPPWYCISLPLITLLLFSSGITFMILYYRYFHVRRLKYEAGGRLSNNNNTNSYRNGGRYYHSSDGSSNHNNHNSRHNHKSNSLNSCVTVLSADDLKISDSDILDKGALRRHSFSGACSNIADVATYSRINNETSLSGEEGGLPQKVITNHPAVGGIPGVFNCRFSNPYVAAMQKRKRKKPTSFVPPPSISHADTAEDRSTDLNAGYNPVPFWYRPLQSNLACPSENESGSVGSRTDIQQKLQEKKQKQLAELRVIEEEIKQGKLHRQPNGNLNPEPPPPPPPPPQDKKPPVHYQPPEILLAPRYLNGIKNENNYYNWNAPNVTNGSLMFQLMEEEPNDQMLSSLYKSHRSPSDLDSQLSLPRSYTLPRQFKYYRRTRPRKILRPEHFVASTNSSDGDVDSGDSDSSSSYTTSHPQIRLPAHVALRTRHETKL